MANYIIIMSTNISRLADLGKLSNTLKLFSNVKTWSIDLTDCDKVLRIEANTDISIRLIAQLTSLNIECKLIGFFTKTTIKAT